MGVLGAGPAWLSYLVVVMQQNGRVVHRGESKSGDAKQPDETAIGCGGENLCPRVNTAGRGRGLESGPPRITVADG